MVRPVRVDGEPVSRAAAAFRFSRPSSYAATAALKAGGLPALVPARPGPGRAHKLTSEIVAFAEVVLPLTRRCAQPRWPMRSRSGLGGGASPLGRTCAGPGPQPQERSPMNPPARHFRRWLTATSSCAVTLWTVAGRAGGSGWRCCTAAEWPGGCALRTGCPPHPPLRGSCRRWRSHRGDQLAGVLASMALGCVAGRSAVTTATAGDKVTAATWPVPPTCTCASPPVRHVLTHTESAAWEYALRQRAVALGWPAEQVARPSCLHRRPPARRGAVQGPPRRAGPPAASRADL